jgi:hypothetical protein
MAKRASVPQFPAPAQVNKPESRRRIKNEVTTMARIKNPPRVAPSAADTAKDRALAPVTPPAGDSPAAAVLAALSADPAVATVAGIARHAGISTAAARQALLACEKNGTATRIKGSRPGIADTWTPATAPAAPSDQAPPAAGQPAPADGTADGGEAQAGPAQEPDQAVTAEAAGNVIALARAADQASQALAAGDLDAALAALDAARDQATQGWRVIKAAATGRRALATRPGALRDLVEDHLRKCPETAFTPHQIGKVLTRSAGAVANALDKLTTLGTAQLITDKPRSYQLTPAPDTAGDPGTTTETAPSAA